MRNEKSEVLGGCIEDTPLSDEIEAMEKAEQSMREEGLVSQEDVKWD
ncbi:MAG: hypothetical protein UHS49_03715 [Faecalimonas sp.]|nr:hypothetical protein [Faecalimonas sp.]